MAEGFMHVVTRDKVIAASTAVRSTGFDPLAQEVMKEAGIDIATVPAKSVKDALKEPFSYVVSVCDASREKFPVWPFCRNIIHWDLIDPEHMGVSNEEKRTILRQLRDEISKRVRFLAGEILSVSLR